MATSITLALADRVKHVKAGAPYSPSLSFNPATALISGCSGILDGLGVTVDDGPSPAQITVDPGSFVQRGIIVEVTALQVVEAPSVPTYPLYLVAENVDEVHSSNVQYLFTNSPNADSMIIAYWPTAPITVALNQGKMSLCNLRDSITSVTPLVVQHDRQVAIASQTVFTLDPTKAFVVGSNKLSVFRNGKRLEVDFDYSEDSPIQFTLTFPALVNDVFEIIVFQGSPPIGSLALGNLTDVTTDLANAIKDSSNLRAALATAANPLATMQDILDAIGSIPPAGLNMASGHFSVIGIGDLIIPTGFTPKIVFGRVTASYPNIAGYPSWTIGVGEAVGTMGSQQTFSEGNQWRDHGFAAGGTGHILQLSHYLGSPGPTTMDVTQFDSTQVKVSVLAADQASEAQFVVLG